MAITSYRDNIFSLLTDAVIACGDTTSFHALDFGAGDGFFCTNFADAGTFNDIVPVDVVKRKASKVTPLIYDGGTLPFRNGSFDLAYAVDVLHHCPSPERSIEEICRCTRKWLLIKDHCYSNKLGWLCLYAMDELGNRRFNIRSPGRYQKDWCWDDLMIEHGFSLRTRIFSARCHSGMLGMFTNKFQYIDLWERRE